MRSKVTKPYDYKLIPVPREMRLWRITDQELEEHLETLSHNHAYEADVDMVELGDSVACRGESAAARWNRPRIRAFLTYWTSGNAWARIIISATSEIFRR